MDGASPEKILLIANPASRHGEGIVDAARDQRRRDESRQPEIALKTRNGGGISRVDFESG